jgi:hypothetical protein
MRSAKVLIGSVILVLAAMPAMVACAGGYGIFGYGAAGYGYGGGFGGGTLEGNYLQGMSQVVRAQGEYNYNTAQAGISYEEARSKYLDNQKKWSQNYFQMKEEQQRLAVQQRLINKQTNEERAAALAARPPVSHGLGPNSLDPLTGRITWPEVLLRRDFEASRTQIDHLFELRAKTSQGAGTSEKIHSSVQEMLSLLRKEIEKIPANQYIAAHKFLNALDYMARIETSM